MTRDEYRNRIHAQMDRLFERVSYQDREPNEHERKMILRMAAADADVEIREWEREKETTQGYLKIVLEGKE